MKDMLRFGRDYIETGNYNEFIRDESNSIANQHVFISNYINKDKALRKMNVLGLVKRKQISCVIVKVSTTLDAKRGSGKYISAFAPYGYVKN
ncbi:MAG: hypothetical protein ACI4EV_05570 [Lachnospiraceae bacterium]